jgi:hypothetical protein
MRTYTAVSGKKYEAGFAGGDPSPIYAVGSTAELREFEAIEQFQILHFEALSEVSEFVTREMEATARKGGRAVRAKLVGFPDAPAAPAPEIPEAPEASEAPPAPKPRPKPRPRPRPEVSDLVKPTAIEEPPVEEPPVSKPKAKAKGKAKPKAKAKAKRK